MLDKLQFVMVACLFAPVAIKHGAAVYAYVKGEVLALAGKL